MTEEEMAVFVAEIRKDLTYLKEKYDTNEIAFKEHIKSSAHYRDKITTLGVQMWVVWLFLIPIAIKIVSEFIK